MKINGKEITKANEELLVIPRGNGENIVFRAKAVLDMSDFYKICPIPKAPEVMLPGGRKKVDIEDKGYLQELNNYGNMRHSYLIIKSLEPSNIEWDQVKISEPGTWHLYEDELKKAGFNYVEQQLIINCVFTANALNETKLEEARESFLASLLEESERLSLLPIAQQNMQSGEPVKDSA